MNNILGAAATRPALHLLNGVLCMLLLMSCRRTAQGQLDIVAITPSLDSSGGGNTLLGTVGAQIATGLLPSGAAAMLWGAVPASAVTAACELIVSTGQHSITANISDDWGGSESLTLQVQAAGGCLAASDASGTLLAFLDDYGRYSGLVCPTSDAGSTGCAVYMTGGDIDTIFKSWEGGSNESNLELLHPATPALNARILLGKLHASISAVVTGVLTDEGCTELGDLAPFCVPGDLAVRRSCNCPGGGNSCCNTCFPGDALVQTRWGDVIPISQLRLGDQVAVWHHDGVVRYDDVYAFGHKDAGAISIFIEITAEPLQLTDEYNLGFDHSYSTNTTTIRLSADHFLPTSTSSTRGGTTLVYKRAQDIQSGDIIWATYHSTSGHGATANKRVLLLSRVKGVSTTWGHGLYNPLTLSGTIIVDGVVASAHSAWFLDAVFDSIGFSHWLPIAYQFVLAPIRGLYQMMGKKAYIFVYDKIDAFLDIPKFGTNYGGRIAMGASATLLTTIFAPLIMRLVVRPTQKPHA